MSSSEEPLTRRELARLLRAFAALVERAEEAGPVPQLRRRSPRKRRPDAENMPPDETSRERARAACRRAGLLP